MLQKIRKMIEQTNMVERGDCILVGCSGGADSVCLLLLMKEIAAEYGASLAAVHVEHGIRQEEMIAFGDGENDMEMLQFAGIGVAMGNAEAEVKALADYVTADIDDDGIWKACKHFGLI